MIDTEVQISISERSSGWAINLCLSCIKKVCLKTFIITTTTFATIMPTTNKPAEKDKNKANLIRGHSMTPARHDCQMKKESGGCGRDQTFCNHRSNHQ